MTAISAVALAVLSLAGPQAVPRAAASQATGIIRGVVTDKETGQPIPRAAVTLRIPAVNLTRQALAGSDGRYEFTGVPAGAFEVLAAGGELRAVYVETWYAPPTGRRTERLEEGEVKAGVNIALARALAISGRVLNDSGEPLARVRIIVSRAGTDSDAAFGRIRTTDDRGLFRVFGLEPGRYVVCTERPMMSGIGVAGVSTAERYIETCHPDSTPAAAQVVVVATTDAEGIDIRMRRSRTFSISGTLQDASGQPVERGQASFHEIVGRGQRSTSVAVLPGGRFVVTGVVPGQYAVSVAIGGPNQPEANRELERAYTPVDVVDRDVEGLILTTRRAALVSGRIVYETGTPPPIAPGSPPMTVEVARDSDSRHRSDWYSIRPVQVREDLTFALSGVFGPQRLTVVNPPPGWIVKSIRHRDDDITETPIEFRPGPNQVEIVLTDRGAVVTGTVADERGTPAAGARVVLFPADPARRASASPFESTVRTNKEGRFTFSPRRPGDYLILALPGTGVQFSTYTRETFERFAAVAERLTLLEADRRTVDLRVTPLPEERRNP